MNQENQKHTSRRKLLAAFGVGTVATLTLPSKWKKPLVNAVVLPAHAQTSNMCMTDATIGGPLAGNPSGSASCQIACEVEAEAQNAQLCNVTESVDAMGATQCSCDLDLP